MHQQKIIKQSLIENYQANREVTKVCIFKERKYNLPPNIIVLYDENLIEYWCRPKSPNYEIISASNDLTIKKWNLKSETCENTLFFSHTGQVKCLVMTLNGELISGSWDRSNNLKVWNLENGAYIRTLIGHTDWVFCNSFIWFKKFVIQTVPYFLVTQVFMFKWFGDCTDVFHEPGAP